MPGKLRKLKFLRGPLHNTRRLTFGRPLERVHSRSSAI